MTITINFRKIAVIGLLLLSLLGLTTACGNNPPSTQATSQSITDKYTQAANDAVPYPLDQMQQGGWLERTLLKENLLRQNNANRLAYVVLLNQLGAPIVQYPIKGMVFSLNSQMTTAQRIDGCTGSQCGPAVTEAAGDNGTWGPEPDGIGFFTTENVEIKWNGLYLESDSPQDIVTKPLITYDASTAKPSVDAGNLPKTK